MLYDVQPSTGAHVDYHLHSSFTLYDLIPPPHYAGMHQGMLSPGLAPPPGPSPLPHFGTAFGSWELPPYSPTSYRQFPTPGTPCNNLFSFVQSRMGSAHTHIIIIATLTHIHPTQLDINFVCKT